MPKSLDDEGRRVWRRIVPQLEAMRVLTHIDREKLERYCHLRSLHVKTLIFLAKAGDSKIVLSADKKRIESVTEYPQVDRLLRLSAALGKIEDEFGMSPSSRARIVAERGEVIPADLDKAKFLRRPSC